MPSTPCPWLWGTTQLWARRRGGTEMGQSWAGPERNSSASPWPLSVAFSQPCRAALPALSSWKLLGREFSGLCAFLPQPYPRWQAGRAGMVVAARRAACACSVKRCGGGCTMLFLTHVVMSVTRDPHPPPLLFQRARISPAVGQEIMEMSICTEA